jgi:hypothetical protein
MGGGSDRPEIVLRGYCVPALEKRHSHINLATRAVHTAEKHVRGGETGDVLDPKSRA